MPLPSARLHPVGSWFRHAGRLALTLVVMWSSACSEGRITADPLQTLNASWQPGQTGSAASPCTQALRGSHTTYDVGPGRTYTDLQDVPWLSLEAGDVVNVHYRPEPYRSRIVLRAQGKPGAPVIINGVSNPQCLRPTVTGEEAPLVHDASKARVLNPATAGLGTVFIAPAYGAPVEQRPRYITIQGLKISGASSAQHYISDTNERLAFTKGAAGIHASIVDHLLVENCEVTGNDNGIFVNTREDQESMTSRQVTLRGNLIHLNGVSGSFFEHNVYVQAAGAIYEGNFIGQLVPGATGSSLKDRSSGTVIRYNHIVAAARAIDLVETDGGGNTVAKEPDYHLAWVYGNLIVSDMYNPGRSSTLLIHWGGDLNESQYRHGTLYFYNNTVVLVGNKDQAGVFYVFDMPSDEQKVDVRQNIFWRAGNAPLALGYKHGRIELQGPNWISDGWLPAQRGSSVTLKILVPPIEGEQPGLDARLRPLESGASAQRGAIGVLAGMPLGPTGAGSPPGFEYTPLGQLRQRQVKGTSMDLGAFGVR
ncbi:hypothetical protein [Aquabacterium sp.]|uniref:hypothetical protein n=1 Tax=Aquabacterium sp. TaxID=1872578 RepID=UPI0035B01CC6